MACPGATKRDELLARWVVNRPRWDVSNHRARRDGPPRSPVPESDTMPFSPSQQCNLAHDGRRAFTTVKRDVA